jgi:NAD-dependent epimerase/dehydratase
VITGATGFIGQHLIQKLYKELESIFAVGRTWRKKSTDFSNNVHLISLDSKKIHCLPDIIEDRDIDTFIHLAWDGVSGNDKKDYRIQLSNCLLACEAVECAKQLGCKRFVFVGSVDEYEFNTLPDQPFINSSHSKIYGVSKLAAETIGKILAKENDIEYVSALLALTYGEGNSTNILPNAIIRNSLANSPMKLIKGEKYFDLIYIQEAIEGICAIAEKGKDKESYYVGHIEIDKFAGTVRKICKVIDSKIDLQFGAYNDIDTPLDYSKIDRRKLLRDTGYECNVPLEEGIRNTKLWIMDIERSLK